MTLTYVYCVVRSARRPAGVNVPSSLPGGRSLQALDAGDGMWLIVSHVPAEQYDEAAVAGGLRDLAWVSRHALAHEGVVERFLRARAVLPMQLFTLFTSDDRALGYVRQHRRRIVRVMTRIERRVEWGVRLTLDERASVAADDAGVAPARSRRLHTRERETGAAYLTRKRDARDAIHRRVAGARAAGERAFRAIAREASAARRMTATETAAPGSRLLVDAAFLVPATRAASFRAAVRRHVPALEACGVALSLTGPWPPYNFVQQPARSE